MRVSIARYCLRFFLFLDDGVALFLDMLCSRSELCSAFDMRMMTSHPITAGQKATAGLREQTGRRNYDLAIEGHRTLPCICY